eukprot:scaffold100771_cov38-Cyclotella_meneghiniana.AAC.1
MEEEYEEEVHQGGEYVHPPRPRNPLEVITGGPMQHEWMDSDRHLFAYKNEYSAGLFMANETIKNMNRGNRKFFVGHHMQLASSRILESQDELHNRPYVLGLCESFKKLAEDGNLYYHESAGRVVTELFA